MITFDSNGGSVVNSVKKSTGTLVYAPISPTRSGYVFDGWYTDVSLTKKVSWPVTLNSNRTFYAAWKSNVASYTVSFISNGGSDVSSIAKPAGTLVYAPVSPTKSGYIFDGWYSSISLTTKVSWPVTLNSNQTFYAGWKSNVVNYTIKFVSNGGSIVNFITKPSGTLVFAPFSPTKSGYIFDGWCTDLSLTKKVSWPVVLNSNLTLYASWKTETISLTQSNFETYFKSTVTVTDVVDGKYGNAVVTCRIDISKRNILTSVVKAGEVTYNIQVTYQYYNGLSIYTRTTSYSIRVPIGVVGTSTKYANIPLSNNGKLESYRISSVTYFDVSGEIKR